MDEVGKQGSGGDVCGRGCGDGGNGVGGSRMWWGEGVIDGEREVDREVEVGVEVEGEGEVDGEGVVDGGGGGG